MRASCLTAVSRLPYTRLLASPHNGRALSFEQKSWSRCSVLLNSSRSSHFSGKLDPKNDLVMQTYLHEDGGRRSKRDFGKPLSTHYKEDARTVYQMLRRGAQVSRHGECFGQRVAKEDETRPYEWISYKEAVERSETLAASILTFGIKPGQDTHIGIFARNTPEWALLEHACYVYNMVNVPVYATHGREECLHIVRQTEMPLIMCDTEDKAELLLQNAHSIPKLRVIVVCSPFDVALREVAEGKGIQLLSFAEFELRGRDMDSPPDHVPPKPEDLATICYTSGTTGAPKGVMVTHANIAAVQTIFSFTNMKIDDSLVYISYMPAAHMFERVVQLGILTVGGRVGFFSGNTQLIVDDCQELRPNFIITVPRVLNKIYNKVYASVGANPVKLFLFKAALAYKKLLLNRGIIRRDTWADKLVFHKVREILGGRVDWAVVGSAPISPEVLTFFRAALGCIYCEGYAQTESSSCGTITLEGDHETGHVGIPVACEIKLLPQPTLGYGEGTGCGEICIRGPLVTKGYYKAPKLTDETFMSDGWLRTGDIGRIDERGRLVLVDRIKNLVKLPNGEFLVPEKVETVYQQSPFIEQIYVHGESTRNHLVAVVVPDKQYFMDFAEQELGIKNASFDELCRMGVVRSAVANHLHALGREKGLVSFEQVSRFFFTDEAFTVEADLLTPTMKNKRKKIAERHANDITWMYAKLDLKEMRNDRNLF